MKRQLDRLKGKRLVTGDPNLMTKDEICINATPNGVEVKEIGIDGSIKDIASGGGGGDSEEKEWYYCKCPDTEVLAVLKGYVAVNIPNPKGEEKIITEADTIVTTYALDDYEFVGYARFLKEDVVVYSKTDSKPLSIAKITKDYVELLLNQVGVEFITKDEYFSKIDIKFEDYPYVETMY